MFKNIISKFKSRKKDKKEVKFSLNYRPDPTDERDYKLSSTFKNFNKRLAKIPKSVDHTRRMTLVKDQGNLGSCVGFAVTAMKEWQEKVEQKQEVAEGKSYIPKPKKFDYSEAWVYWNAKKIDAWPNEEGTSIRYAMKVLNRIGVPTEKAWPYSDIKIGKPKKWAPMIAKWAWIGKYWRIDNLDELKVALVNGPVPIGIACFEEIFYVGRKGKVKDPKNPNKMYGGHAICAVGYNDKTKLIKFKNSWGRNWGNKGYGYISYNYIKNYMWDAWTCQDIKVTRDMLKETKSLYG